MIRIRTMHKVDIQLKQYFLIICLQKRLSVYELSLKFQKV